MFGRHFLAYGVRIALGVDCPALLDRFVTGICRSAGGPLKTTSLRLRASVQYLLLADEAEPSYRLYAGTTLVAAVRTLTDVGWALATHAEPFVAEHAPDHLFVHAGVVGWEGRAIVMPGTSFAGKTTLVRAWLEAGATYYSDEFAVLDRAGRVHPFAATARDPGRVERCDSSCAGRGTGRRHRHDASARRPGPGDCLPARRALATERVDAGYGAACADASHCGCSREPGAFNAYSEAGSE
jgi:hypothetical protein